MNEKTRERLLIYAVLVFLGVTLIFAVATIIVDDFRANGSVIVGVILVQLLGLIGYLGGVKVADLVNRGRRNGNGGNTGGTNGEGR